MSLESLGWSPTLQFHLDEVGRPDVVAGRVCRVDRGGLSLLCEHGEVTARGNADVVDLEGTTIIPGLHDAHVHIRYGERE